MQRSIGEKYIGEEKKTKKEKKNDKNFITLIVIYDRFFCYLLHFSPF